MMKNHKVENVRVEDLLRVLNKFKEQDIERVNLDITLNEYTEDTVHIEPYGDEKRDFLKEEATKRAQELKTVSTSKEVLTVEQINKLLNN